MKTCHCLIKHANTPKEREEATHRLAEARKVGDSIGTHIALAQLCNGSCPAKPIVVNKGEEN